jgi:L-ascorbate metabolism protein UlaG (beta-lactamase superfamily)
MIEPVMSGFALASEIVRAEPAPGTLAVWWLGQSGFVFKGAGWTLVLDPYLSEHLTSKYAGTRTPHVRMTRAPLAPGALSGVDFVLCSHKHSDHLDPGTLPELLAASPGATLIVPESLRDHVAQLGIPPARTAGLDAGIELNAPGLSIRGVASAHEGLDTDAWGRHLYLGFVITIGGLRFYHSGDSLSYEGLDAAIGPEPLDLMFLPINGRDPARGVPGNMSAEEAVDLANRLRPRYLVPHHYDMFTFNTVPVTLFDAEARRLSLEVCPRVLRCGERWEVQRWV